MLQFGDIIAHVGKLAAETARRTSVRSSQTEIAVAQAKLPAAVWRGHHDRILGAQTAWLTARPISAESVASAVAKTPLNAPTIYTAFSVDGSQIPLDRHEIAVCYLLNIGSVAIHYGTGDRPTLTSRAALHYTDKDVLIGASDADGDAANSYITDRELSNRRFLAEIDALGDLIDACADRPDVVGFIDGTLILWTQETEEREERAEAVLRLSAMLEKARERRIPIIGYLSRPASREVIGALRVSLCPLEHVVCKLCPYVERGEPLPCAPIDRLCDADLFSELLRPRERSGLFMSQSKILSSYKPAHNKIGFFYLNTGREIARIELPRWVCDDPALLARSHAVTLDQIDKGAGYPICLTEAHEQAVVRAPDRAAFFRLVERALVGSGQPAVRTAKAVAKRRGVL